MTALVMKMAKGLSGQFKPKGYLIAIEKKRLLMDGSGNCVGMDVVLWNRRILPSVRTKVSVTVRDQTRRIVARGVALGTLARRDITVARIDFNNAIHGGPFRFHVEVQWPTMGGDDAERAAGPNQATADFVATV